MKERPIIIKTETNLNPKEQQAQRLKQLSDQYNRRLLQKGYPYLYDNKQGFK